MNNSFTVKSLCYKMYFTEMSAWSVQNSFLGEKCCSYIFWPISMCKIPTEDKLCTFGHLWRRSDITSDLLGLKCSNMFIYKNNWDIFKALHKFTILQCHRPKRMLLCLQFFFGKKANFLVKQGLCVTTDDQNETSQYGGYIW